MHLNTGLGIYLALAAYVLVLEPCSAGRTGTVVVSAKVCTGSWTKGSVSPHPDLVIIKKRGTEMQTRDSPLLHVVILRLLPLIMNINI